MPIMTTVSLADGQATPVTHLFKSYSLVNGVLYLRAMAASGLSLAAKLLSINTRTAGKRKKVKFFLQLPVVQVQTINGVSSPVIVDRDFFEGTFTFGETADNQRRKDVRKLVGGLFADTQVDLVKVIDEDDAAR